MVKSRSVFVALAVLLSGSTAIVRSHAAETPDQLAATPPAMEEPSTTNTLDAAEADGDVPRRRLVKFNEYEGPLFTLRVGLGTLYDTAGYAQDDASETQLTLVPKTDLRDFRFLLKGRLKFLPRVSYTLGYMYDKPTDDWLFRQTGLMIDVPELQGNIFIGRTKEGFSTLKIMNGYSGWLNERATISDALIPILADGIKWTGNLSRGRFVYNLGWFNDTKSENESFNKNDKQFVARAVWLPFNGSERKDLLHLALDARYAESEDGFLQYRSKPEVAQAQSYAIDTGKFAADHATALGVEEYYRRGPFIAGSEYFFNQVASEETGDPFFHGGDVFVAYLLTGETRSYNAKGAFFEFVSPTSTVFEGGPGAWEAVLRYSYSDLDQGVVHGGEFWRITPAVNWYMSDNVRLEFVTGYGMLDRFDTQGGTVFIQTRLQLLL